MTSGEFKSILLPCYKRMYLTAFAILRDHDDASDAVQDAITSLWQKHKELKIPDNPQAFCNRIVRNTSIDRLRVSTNRYFENIDNLGAMAGETKADAEASFTTTSAFISELLISFKEKQRKILILSIFSQLANDEICEITGESPENVRTIISRGRKKIKEYLNNET